MKPTKEIESKICDFLLKNHETKLKEFFLADLSWVIEDKDLKSKLESGGYATNRKEVIIKFFKERFGKRVYNILPQDIKDYINSNEQ
jgi:hypothetical protein